MINTIIEATPSILILILSYLNWYNSKRIEKLEQQVKDININHIGK